MEDAKSVFAQVELATGVVDEAGNVQKTVLIREMTGIEEDILASRKMKVHQKLTNIICNCVTKFGDHEEPLEIKKLVKRLIVSDRWLILIHLRIASFGPIYQFRSECPSCGKEDNLDFDLTNIKVINAPDAKVMFKEVKISTGDIVRFRVADSLFEEKMEDLANDTNAATIALFARITEINNDPVSLFKVQTMRSADRALLRKEIEKIEGNLDNEYTATCKFCGEEYKNELPISGADFFLPIGIVENLEEDVAYLIKALKQSYNDAMTIPYSRRQRLINWNVEIVEKERKSLESRR